MSRQHTRADVALLGFMLFLLGCPSDDEVPSERQADNGAKAEDCSLPDEPIRGKTRYELVNMSTSDVYVQTSLSLFDEQNAQLDIGRGCVRTCDGQSEPCRTMPDLPSTFRLRVGASVSLAPWDGRYALQRPVRSECGEEDAAMCTQLVTAKPGMTVVFSAYSDFVCENGDEEECDCSMGSDGVCLLNNSRPAGELVDRQAVDVADGDARVTFEQ